MDTIGDFQDPSIQKFALDVTSDDAIQGVVHGIVEREGKIDVVVNNAGFFCPGMANPINYLFCYLSLNGRSLD